MTRGGLYRLGIVLPLVGFALAAGLRVYFDWERSGTADSGARTERVYPHSITRELIAYLGVTLWVWSLVNRDPRALAERALWLAPLLFVGLTSLLVALVAVTEERGVAGGARQIEDTDA